VPRGVWGGEDRGGRTPTHLRWGGGGKLDQKKREVDKMGKNVCVDVKRKKGGMKLTS